MRSKPSIRVLIWLLVMLLTAPTGLGAQQPTQGQETGTEQPYTYSQQQLDELLAPIALYPDTVLSQILMASTYPLEVVEADRWLKQNKGLSVDALDAALKDKPWDVSVKSLCHFPQVLSMMDENLQQTTDLGNAFLSQQDQVMDTVQKLRQRAQAQGNLESTDKQQVVVQDGDISIEPPSPEVIYVPAYDPCWVYGPWWYPTCYPPWFWYPGVVVGVGFFWGPGIFIGPIDFWCGFFWHRHSIFVNVNKTVFIHRIGATRMHGGIETWRHNPIHRRGVAYRDTRTAQRFGRAGAAGVETRRSFRGFAPERGTAPGRAGGVSHPETQPRMRAPTSMPSGRSFEQPRGGHAFQGFGGGAIESRQQSERGRQSMEASPRGGGPSGGWGTRPSGGGGGGAPRGGGFGGGGHPSGGGHMGR